MVTHRDSSREGKERQEQQERGEPSAQRQKEEQGARGASERRRAMEKEEREGEELATNIHWNIIRFKDAPSAVRLITHEWMITKQQAIS